MIAYTAQALRDLKDLRDHYNQRGRPEAVRALDRSLRQAEQSITAAPAAGLEAPRPYPSWPHPDEMDQKRPLLDCLF